MSALDRAFIKAHTKESSPRAATPDAPPTAMPDEPALRSDLAPPAPASGSTDPPEYRFDGAHSVRRGPYLAAGPLLPPAPRDVAVERLDPARLELPPTCAPHVPAPAASREAAEPRGPTAPPDRPLAAANSPPLLAAAEPDLEVEQPFAPDWEVDRLVWPAVCERLLETEERYFRSVGQRLKDATQDSHHVVMITGARRGEGRTTLALCLARCAARAGVSVALVDADLDNPQLGSQLGMETPGTWLAVVAGKSPLSEAGVASLEDGLTLFPLTQAEAREAPPDAPALRAVLRAIAVQFPLVIVDTGPIANDDHHPFADGHDCPIDTAIVVRDLRNTTEKKTLATARLLQRRGVPAVGIAENFRDPE